MNRAPFQVLVFPFRKTSGGRIEYAIFNRSDGNYWQAIAGGGKDNETPIQAAKREAWEEAGVPTESCYLPLDSRNTVPVVGVTGEFTWGKDLFVVPEHTFGVEINDTLLVLSREHTQFEWVEYERALDMLKWDSNKNALWELNERLLRQT